MNISQMPSVFTSCITLRTIACAAIVLTYCVVAPAQEVKKTSDTKPALTVTTTRPASATLPIRLAANGNIAAWQEASVGSEINGLRLAQVLANVGDEVQRGQVLAVFATDSVEADVAQAKAAVAEAQAQTADASANARRAQSFQSTGMMSAQQISLLLTAEQVALARLESARAMLAVQQLRLRQTEVKAPDGGIISARGAMLGAVPGTGTELFRLIRQGRLEWRAEVTSSELARLRVGTPATVTAANGAVLQGKVRMVAPTVDPLTRNTLVYVDLPTGRQSAQTAKPGMFARGEFELGSSGALTVPRQSVVARDGFNYVFKVSNDKRVSQLKVEVGRRIGEQVEITLGLQAEAEIAVAGAGFLNDGDLVRVNNAVEGGAAPARPTTSGTGQSSSK